MNLDVSASALNMQADLLAAELNTILHNEFHKNNKTWSSWPTAPYLTSHGEGLVVAEYERSSTKSPRRVGDLRFEVDFIGPPRDMWDPSFKDTTTTASGTCKSATSHEKVTNIAESGKDFADVPIPLFTRTRTVTIDDSGVMFCDCCKYESRGYFCADHISVAKLVYKAHGLEFPGFTHHDVAMRYWLAFMHFAYKQETSPAIQALLHQLCQRESLGPKLALPVPDSIDIESPSPPQSALDRLKNYDKTKINLDSLDGMRCFTHDPSEVSMSEEDIDSVFLEMFEELQNSSPESFVQTFEQALSDDNLGDSPLTHGGARGRVKPLINTAYNMADRLGEDAVTDLVTVIQEFNDNCAAKLAEMDSTTNEKRKYVPYSQETYCGTKKRVFNTHHMR